MSTSPAPIKTWRKPLIAIFSVAFLASLSGWGIWAAQSANPEVLVYKSPTCGCCTAWVDHLKTAGLRVKAVNTSELQAIKEKFGVPGQVQACHTAIVGDYFIEGHVPATDVQRLLQEKPAIKGIAVPGMPLGSPGMEGPNPERYQVLSVEKDNSLQVYAEHQGRSAP